MKETTLLKIALICSIVGLAALYFASLSIQVKEYKPEISSKNAGDDVKFSGAITKIADKGDVVFIDIAQQNTVTVVLFTDEDNLKLKSGDNVEVIGEVQDYKGKIEIIAQKIRVIK